MASGGVRVLGLVLAVGAVGCSRGAEHESAAAPPADAATLAAYERAAEFAEESPPAEESARFGPAMEGVTPFGGAEREALSLGAYPGDEDLVALVGGAGGGGGGPSPTAVAAKEDRATAPPPAATWKRSRLVPNASRLRVGDEETLPLDAMEATVRVDGPRARVVLDCLFRNDRGRPLEGTFELRLPDGASPYYFGFGESVVAAPAPAAAPAPGPAFLGTVVASARATSPTGISGARESVWSEVREARMVPRERAAWAYGETTRRRVDPALLEWSGAGVFSARVFPIQPAKVHRIVVGYDVDLVAVGEDLEYRLDLPPGVPHRAVTLSVAGGGRAGGGRVGVEPSAPGVADGDRTVFTFRDPDDSAITLRLTRPGTTLLTGDDDEIGPCFSVDFRPELPDVAAGGGSPRAVFLLDTSLSSNPERFPVWLRLLREVLDRNRGTIREFAVLYFDVQTTWWQESFVANTPANVAALLADADGLSLEGATDLGAALGAASDPAFLGTVRDGPATRHDLFLLSDGAATWGASDAAEIEARLAAGHAGALYAYRTGFAGTDAAMLTQLARATGGGVFSVVGDAEVAAAATAHTRRPYLIRGVSVAGGSDLLLEGRPTTVFPGQVLHLVGRGAPPADAAIRLDVQQEGGPLVTVETRPARVLRSDLAPRAYGQVAVAQIEEFGDDPASPAKSYATHFRVVGRTCSLVMLESEADYERYGIVPEDEAHRVREAPAAPHVAAKAEARRREGSDPRADLLAVLRRLETTPGVTFHAPEELIRVVEGLPPAAFRVPSKPLACRARRWKDVPGAVQEQLASRELTYDVIAKEAARRREAFGPPDALRALSSLVESQPGDAALARDVAFTALDWDLAAPAYHLFRRVARSRPYEPETWRALAECLERAGNADLALVHHEIAVNAKWDPRFGSFRTVASMDYVRFLRRVERGDVEVSAREYATARRLELEDALGDPRPDLVVVVTWNSDRSDVDLHVTDPAGETCMYNHTRTRIGGTITQDVTQGYGPEMFVLAKAVPGKYRVDVHYFASDTARASLRSKVLATVYEHWGTPEERVTRNVLTLRDGDQTETVTTIRVP